MAINNLLTPFQRSPRPFDYLWLPLLFPLFLLAVDYLLVPDAYTLPFLLILLLGYLAFRLPGWLVFSWALAYTLVILIIPMFGLQEGHTRPLMRPYLRTATFLSASLVATLLAVHRVRLEKSYKALFNVVSSLPLAVIVSDISGNILLMNQAAEKLLHDRFHDLVGLSFFSTFTNPGDQGQAIAKYISYFNPDNYGPFPVTLQTRGKNPVMIKGTVTVVGSDQLRYAVTVIENVEEQKADCTVN